MVLPALLVAFCSTQVLAQANCQLNCNDEIQVSLDNNCEALITYDLMLEDPNNPAICLPNGPNAFQVIVMSPDFHEVVADHGEVITCEDVSDYGYYFPVKVKHWASGNECWGSIIVEDKKDPWIGCPPAEIWCNEHYDPAYIEAHYPGTGYPSVSDNCSGESVIVINADGEGNDATISEASESATVDCYDIVLTYEDLWINYDCSVDGLSGLIERTWTATDASGNTKSCVQTIEIARATLADVELPRHYDDLPGNLPAFRCEQSCAWDIDAYSTGDSDDPHFDCTDYPTIHGFHVDDTHDDYSANSDESSSFCEINVTWEDTRIEACGPSEDPDHKGTFKILRDWRLVDWCTGEILNYTQIIKVVDDQTNIACPAPFTAGTSNTQTSCSWWGELPPATVTNNGSYPECSWYDVTTTVTAHAQLVPHGPWEVVTVAVIEGNGGDLHIPYLHDYHSDDYCNWTFYVTYDVVDDCGNHDSCETSFTITDDDAPIAVSQEVTQITLEGDPFLHGDARAVAYAETFNSGSHDNCTYDEYLYLQVSRDNSSWGEYVEFTCADNVDANGDGVCDPVTVFFRVTDFCGNVSEETMVLVTVDDKSEPVVEAYPDATFDCDVVHNLGNDGPGNVTGDSEDYEAAILAAFEGIGDPFFDGPFVGFVGAEGWDNCTDPVDITIRVTNFNINPCGEGYLDVCYRAHDNACPTPLSSSEDCQRFTFVDNTDLVVNFPSDRILICSAEDGEGFTGDTSPETTGSATTNADCELDAINYEDQFFEISDNACYKILRTWTVIDWCDFTPGGPNTEENGVYIDVQEIKILDETAPDVECPEDETVCIDDTSCGAEITIVRPPAVDCAPDDYLTYTYNFDGGPLLPLPADGVTIRVDLDAEDEGWRDYAVQILVEDNCNNAAWCDYTVRVTDCYKPSPYCYDELTFELGANNDNDPSDACDDGHIVTWPEDFDAGSFDNCTAQEDLEFAIRRAGSGDAIVYGAGITFTCCDLGAIDVELWVRDQHGNEDFCVVTANVQDNMGVCGAIEPDPEPLVAGTVQTETHEMVEHVEVSVNGSEDMNDMMMTSAAGTYNFNVPMGGDYTITPAKDINPLNGVTTFDLVVARKHILGIELLDSPYKMIAADVNNSGSITTFDMVELRKLILQINTEFQNNTSWRFVDASYAFPDASNPWVEQFPELININNIDAAFENADFMAVKIGDLNGSATPNSLLGGVEDRTNGTVEFNVADQAVKAGNTYTVDFSADLTDIEGYQFTLNYNGLELTDIVEGTAKADNFGVFAQEGAVTTSWNGEATTAEFSLVFTATANGELSEMISVSSNMTKAEAYAAGETMDVALNFNGRTVAAAFELYQNTPNPFAGETMIGFNLTEAGAATLTVQDATGKVLSIVRGQYAKGYNQVTLNSSSLSASGVLYYTLETANQTATKKMVLIK